MLAAESCSKISYTLRSPTMSRDSQASFSNSVRALMRQAYGCHCSICLNLLTQEGSHCAHLIDSGIIGAKQLSSAVRVGMLPSDYKPNSVVNGLVQCPNCHLSYFTQEHIALSPPLPVLQYLMDYLYDTAAADRKPLHEVFDLLLEARGGVEVELPDPTAILPYIGLFSLILLNPDGLKGHVLLTTHLPGLSVLHNGHFVPAPANTLPTAPSVARIFDVFAVINANAPKQLGHIPLSPQDPEFEQQRYWRLPAKNGAILAALIERVRHVNDGCAEIVAAQIIRDILSLSLRGISVLRPSQSGSGRGGGGGGGPSGGDSCDNKGEGGRKRRTTQTSGSSTKKNRRATRDDTVEGGESKSYGEVDSADRSRSPPHGVNPDDWEVASSFSSLGDGPTGMGSPCGTDFYPSSNTPPPPDGENSSDWQFGPSFSTNKIVFTARAVSLV